MSKILFAIKYFFGKPHIYVKREYYRYEYDRKYMQKHLVMLFIVLVLYCAYLFFKLSSFGLSGLKLDEFKVIDYIALAISILKIVFPIIYTIIIKSVKHFRLLNKFIDLGVEDEIRFVPSYIIINTIMVIFSLGGSFIITQRILDLHISYMMLFSGILVFLFEFLVMLIKMLTTRVQYRTKQSLVSILFEKVTGSKL